MLTRAGLLTLALAVAAGPAVAQPFTGTIVTGPTGTADLAVGEDIARIADACGVGLRALPSEGSVENMQAVRDRRNTQLGIVQGDVLEYYQTLRDDDPSLRRPAQGIRVVMPLQESAVHLVARDNVERLEDLSGRVVATGTAGSGTAITAGLVLDLAGVAPAGRVPLAPDAALDALRSGVVDAAFIVSAAPADLLATADLADAHLHLVPMDEPALTAAYSPATIAAGTYPFVSADVPVVAVRSLLVAYDFSAAANNYQAASCRLVSDVSHLILTRLDELRASGHPSWATADLTALPPGAQISPCALQGVDPDYAFTCRRPDGTISTEGAAVSSDAAALFVRRICARLGC